MRPRRNTIQQGGLMAGEDQKVKIVVPWRGPMDDEWDNPGYNDFWGPVERRINQQIRDAEKEGREVEFVTPDDSKE